MLLDQILLTLVMALVQQDGLVLAEGARPEDVAAHLRDRLGAAPRWSQAGSAIGDALVHSPLVDELFASDEDIIEALSGLTV